MSWLGCGREGALKYCDWSCGPANPLFVEEMYESGGGR